MVNLLKKEISKLNAEMRAEHKQLRAAVSADILDEDWFDKVEGHLARVTELYTKETETRKIKWYVEQRQMREKMLEEV